MFIITFDGLVFSPLILFIVIASLLTIVTNLVAPKILYTYTNLKLSWINLSLFICYLGMSMLIFGD